MMNYRNFLSYWISQFVSILGSNLTKYALTFWIFQTYQSASSVAFGVAAMSAARILIGPLAGVYVDRLNRKTVLILAEAGQALSILALCASIFCFDTPPLPVIYAFLAIGSAFDTLHYPALISTIPQLVKREHLVRANSLISFSDSTSTLTAPLLAACLLPVIQIKGILFLDVISFILSITGLIFIKFPSLESKSSIQSSILKDLKAAFEFIRTLPGVSQLLLINGSLNFFISGCFVLIAPMILKSTGGNTLLLSSLMAFGGTAQLVVGLSAATLPTPKSIIRTNMLAITLLGIFGAMLIGVTRDPFFWGFGIVAFMGAIPFINSTNRSIWQSKVPTHMQGRFFAARRALSQASVPIAEMFAGILVDQWIDPIFPSPAGLSYNLAIFGFGSCLTAIGLYGFFSKSLNEFQQA